MIFIAPPSLEEMRRRLESRATEDLAEIDDRLDSLAWEMAFSDECDYVVVNETGRQTQAARQLGEIINKARRNRREDGAGSVEG